MKSEINWFYVDFHLSGVNHVSIPSLYPEHTVNDTAVPLINKDYWKHHSEKFTLISLSKSFNWMENSIQLVTGLTRVCEKTLLMQYGWILLTL